MSDLIRPMREQDVDAAREIYRQAFAAFTQLPPHLLGASDTVGFRYHRDPSTALVLERDGAVIAACVSLQRGSVGLVGPVMVSPAAGPSGAGTRLLAASHALMAERGVRVSIGFTFASSAGHLKLVSGFGFKPQCLNAILRWPPPPAPARRPDGWVAFSEMEGEPAAAALQGGEALADAIYPGWSFRRDVETVRARGVGETLIARDGARVDAIAICHHGPGSEANGPGQLAIRLAAVRPGAAAVTRFSELLAAVDAYAATRGLKQVVAGLPTLRRAAYRQLLARPGSAVIECGVGFERGDDGYAARDELLLDDWR